MYGKPFSQRNWVSLKQIALCITTTTERKVSTVWFLSIIVCTLRMRKCGEVRTWRHFPFSARLSLHESAELVLAPLSRELTALATSNGTLSGNVINLFSISYTGEAIFDRTGFIKSDISLLFVYLFCAHVDCLMNIAYGIRSLFIIE